MSSSRVFHALAPALLLGVAACSPAASERAASDEMNAGPRLSAPEGVGTAETVATSEDALRAGSPDAALAATCAATSPEATGLSGAEWPGRRELCEGGRAASRGLRGLFPFPIHSAPWWPPRAPKLAGPTAPNDDLASAERLAEGLVPGAEDVALDAQGRLYGGVADGRILRITFSPSGAPQVETFAQTAGRPLGMVFAPDGRLLVAVAEQGLLAIGPDGAVTPLVTEAAGRPVAYADGLDVTKDGVVYFTDASTFAFEDYTLDYLDARPRGRLLRHDLRTGETAVLLEGLFFPNGVALASDESYLVFTETPRYRVTKYALTGASTGRAEVIVDNLPGFPDGVSRAEDGSFWVALYTERNKLLDLVHPLPPVKNVLAALPPSLQPKPARYGFVLHVDGTGRILGSLQDPDGAHIANVTSVRERDGFLYLGSLTEPYVGRITRP